MGLVRSRNVDESGRSETIDEVMPIMGYPTPWSMKVGVKAVEQLLTKGFKRRREAVVRPLQASG